ncbi:MAG: DUF3990 domain-containing protein [Planctomycetaceae bacterium]|jgi:hypothetical protein|nr:DUF3990 domain-containing protein [Planctomycetaceae bacterium]
MSVLRLFHGSTEAVSSPQIISDLRGRDFGFGFYTTDIAEQSKRWALRRALIKYRNGDESAKGIVSIYDFDDQHFDELKVLRFQEANLEWLDFVCRCRSNPDYVHGYDIVIGKIANDNVGETINFVVRGIMRKEDALQKLRFQQINNQICFTSENALRYLQYIKCEKFALLTEGVDR